MVVAAPAAFTEERKVVSALFCDLVGFTATSEAADPEDVDRMLGAYFAMARGHIEAFGGIVQKFIGDAVVGVFGVPVAHEDDPERAVRAALRIAADARGLRGVRDEALRLRIGINTGEALVRVGVAPGSGEHFLTGDTINTASRIQSAAPEMGVGVGRATYEATKAVFEYAELPAATLKGKAEPVPMFHALAPRARVGIDLVRRHATPYIGREIDLTLLKGVFDKALDTSTTQLVTVVGEPGLGKSRIVAELFGYVDGRPDLVTWRQGRCLPYGDGITFWALGEILKAHAGILDTDDPATAAGKLEAVLPTGPDRSWFRERLLPLVGIEAASTAQRDELFTAWRRFLEGIADERPAVFVFEDLHWADPALLAFLEHLADWTEGVPMLVIGTARPDLFERHPDFGRGLRNTTFITLRPLSPEDTSRFVSALLGAASVPAALEGPVVERAGGNPLYAEEFIHLLTDRGLLQRHDGGWVLRDGADVSLPGSVQAVIAARLDALAPDRKAMLADAAVIGKVFWAGAVAAMSGQAPEDVAEAMRELSRRELIRPMRRSSMAGESEFAFWHALTREVAYAQLSRPARAARHVAAARWIESTANERLEDRADVLAYHYTTALELARAAGQGDTGELEANARRFLGLAGERAMGLDPAAALDAFAQALALTPESHLARAEMLVRYGMASQLVARHAEAAAALEEALETFRARGDPLGEAHAIHLLFRAIEHLNTTRWQPLRLEQATLLERLPAGPELVETLAGIAERATSDGRPEEGIALADRALAVAADAGLPRSSRALHARASARCILGDRGGFGDYREVLEIATDAGESPMVAVTHANMGIDLLSFEGPRAALETFGRGLALAESRGLSTLALAHRTVALGALAAAGEYAAVLADAETLGGHAEAAGDEFDLLLIRCSQAVALTAVGRAAEASWLPEWLADAARRSGRVDVMAAALPVSLIVDGALARQAAVTRGLRELVSTPRIDDATELSPYLPAIVRVALAVGERELVEPFTERLAPRYPYAEHAQVAVRAALAEARGDRDAAAAGYRDAAERWEAFGVAPEQGFALAGRGRCLLASGSPGEAIESLRLARDVFARTGMLPALDAVDELLRAAGPPR
jgi:class 3 adenylate cyclase/tetratricopeptide (TPR) repeat protein